MRRALAALLLVAAPVWAGASRTFDGTDDTVAMGDVLGFERTDAFSFAFYHRESATSPAGIYKYLGKRPLSGNFQGYDVSVRGDVAGDPYAVAIAATASKFIEVRFPRANDTGWHCAVATYDGSNSWTGVKFYRDGVEQSGTDASNGTMSTSILSTAPFRLGAGHDGTIQFFPGSLAYVAVFSRVLTAGEAATYCHLPISVPSPSAFWWLLDVGAAPTYRDLSGAGLDGNASDHPAEPSDGPPVMLSGGPQ